ncbi:dual specificity phosphatase catalytic domain protein [Talaromyces stipitatus ATCC 10500]|uniref:Dual specificity phosphatase catalytic domain protein n=1 Tax=Talaromyces stipitatus (strain ATCC 10500 / CBS 375.48 / QM 6759 / NRRL 1006) TaxID=441959 RepID=B8MFC9_TALSN|nr:dual specificity phosphatase catalytic domain protein [Talaromyces stipitatus ATCC 10500]EED16663.1 dual specificity phosphatase catalytic domain protein [Talaromyces stipitatus ATCC 10500]
MASCGFLSHHLFRRSETAQLFVRERHHRKNTNVTVTSSEDDSDGYSSPSRKVTMVEEKQPAAGYRRFSPNDEYIDPGLLKKHCAHLSYTTSVATYPAIRTFFSPHPHMDKLPSEPTPIPMLVFIHGLGGSLAQFHPLLTSLSNVGPCFGIDLPGCGLSTFAPKSWEAYSLEALAELVAVAIEEHRDKVANQGVLLIAHSLGCSLSALLASSSSTVGKELKPYIKGVIAICPKASPPTAQETALARKLLYIPTPIFDMWRLWDRRGGAESKSVRRFVGEKADPDTKQLQLRFNAQSRSDVWRRMAWGSLPVYNSHGEPIGGMPGKTLWSNIRVPLLLVAGDSDAVTKATEVAKIVRFMGGSDVDSTTRTGPEDAIIPDAARVHDTRSSAYTDARADEEIYGLDVSEKQQPDIQSTKGKVVRTRILPAPASHALLYDRATYRTLAGLIQDFVQKYIDHRLSLGWQLQHLNTSGKWDVKNLVKWQKVPPTSAPIAKTFIAMKMLRGVDEVHNPVHFSEEWRGKIHAVIDISHENPVYDPHELEKGGIHYHKHPTVSKIPPTPDETRDFIGLVDQLEKEITEKTGKDVSDPTRPLIGVHCHYGFNRTGFLIVSYLIERKGYGVQDAIDEFQQCRPPGIRHDHFIDTLFVRYCVGLKRSTTLE